MPKICTCCRHSKRSSIDRALLVSNDTIRAIAKRYRVSEDALGRHRRHMAQAVKTAAAARADYGNNLLELIRAIRGEVESLGASAAARGSTSEALRCQAQLLKVVELESRMVGALGDGGTRVQVNIAGVNSAARMSREEAIATARQILELYAADIPATSNLEAAANVSSPA